MAQSNKPVVMTTVASMQAHVDEVRRTGKTLALVPTMGGLHAGHLALVRRARQLCDHVTVTIFVNPVQFGPGEDYTSYPRNLAGDLQVLATDGGVDAVFAPSPRALFPYGASNMQTWVEAPKMVRHLCGRRRSGHFRGVLTIVTKLLHCCRPDTAVFGLKDAQQFFLIRRMVRELNFVVKIEGVETVREPSGLAMSSRNIYLNSEEREQAHVLSRAVDIARTMIAGGERAPDKVVHAMCSSIAPAPLAQLEYAEVVLTATLAPTGTINPGQEVLAAVAARLGRARLIDNAIVTSPATD